jgi:hypothetical protein
MIDPASRPARLAALAGAVLLLATLSTGFLLAAAETGRLDAEPHTIAAAHVTGFLGALLLFALAATMPLLRYKDLGRLRLVWLLAVPQFAGWFLTIVKAFPRVRGIEPGESTANNVVFLLLTVFVVLPALAGALGWIYGLVGTER